MKAAAVRAVALAVALVGGTLAAAAGEPPDGEAAALEQGIHHFRLDNGFDLVVAVRPELRLAAVNLTAAVGAVDDPPELSGIAHVLEHMTLSGSVRVGSLDPEAEAAALAEVDRVFRELIRARRSEAPDPAALSALERRFEKAHAAALRTAEEGEILGGRLEARGAIGLNATTSVDATQYFGWIPTDQLELWISLEAERLRWPIFRRFYSEREVVLQEVAALTGGRSTIHELLFETLHPDGPPSQPVAGDPREIATIDRAAALGYFDRYYRPENLAMAVVGDVDPEQVRRLCARYFAPWRPEGEGGELPEHPAVPPGAHVGRFNSTRAPIVLMAFPQPRGQGATEAALDALAELINSPELSPLQGRLIAESGAAWEVRAEARYPSEKTDAVFLLRLYGNPGIAHELLVREASAQLEELPALSDEDLRGAARLAEVRLAGALDDPPELASLLALHQAVHDDWRTPFERLRRLRGLQPDDLRRAARDVLAAPVPGAAEPPVRRAAAPAAVDAPPGLDQLLHLELDNGLQVLLGRPQRPAPHSEVLLVVRAGTGPAAGGPGEAAWLAAEAFLGGSLPGDQPVRRRLAQIGASVDHTVGREAAVFRFSVPARLTGDLLDLLAGLLRGPRPPEVWRQAGSRRRLALARQQSDPWQHSTRVLDELLWDEPPAAVAPAPAAPPAEVDRWRAEQELRRSYVPGRAVLAVWGALDPEALAPRVRAAFGRLPAGGEATAGDPAAEHPPEPPPDPTLAPAGAIRCLQAPGANPPAMLIGFGTEIEDEVDFYAWQVLAHILGASHDSRLHRRLRLAESLAYTAEASCLPMGSRGLTLRIACQTPDLERTRRVVREELERLASEEVSQRELDLARSIFRSRLMLDQASFRDQFYRRALRLLGVSSVRSDHDGERALEALTPARLLALARETLRPERAATVVISEEPSPLCDDEGGRDAR